MIQFIRSNVTILAIFLAIIAFVYRRNYFNVGRSRLISIILGALFGLLGVHLITRSYLVTEIIHVDISNLAIISSTMFGGAISAILTTLIMMISNLAIYGINAFILAETAVYIIIVICCHRIFKTKLSRLNKYILMFIVATILTNINLFILLEDKSKVFEVILFFYPANIMAGFMAYLIFDYIIYANDSFKEMNYYKLMANNLVDVIITFKLDGTISYISTSSMNLLNYNPKELIGECAFDYIHPEDVLSIRESVRKIIGEKGYQTLTYRVRTKNNQYIWVESLTKCIYSIEGNVVEVISTLRDITQRHNFEEKLNEAKLYAEITAKTDYLTGLLNRRAFVEKFEEEISRVKRSERHLSIIMMDIDYFKRINDFYGHQVGDLVLQKLSEYLKCACRAYDFVCRFGGEEFLICFPEANKKETLDIAERIRSGVEAMRIEVAEKAELIKVTASFGVASYDIDSEESFDSLVNRADHAMYEAKLGGRNRVCE